MQPFSVACLAPEGSLLDEFITESMWLRIISIQQRIMKKGGVRSSRLIPRGTADTPSPPHPRGVYRLRLIRRNLADDFTIEPDVSGARLESEGNFENRSIDKTSFFDAIICALS
jgi:hypothetical protein